LGLIQPATAGELTTRVNLSVINNSFQSKGGRLTAFFEQKQWKPNSLASQFSVSLIAKFIAV